MKHENTGEMKQKILDAAWKLFEEKGYVKTTLNDILKEANTSKGGFYYYFKAKDELLESMYVVFDKEYEKFYANMDKTQNHIEQFLQLSQYMFFYIEANVTPELMAELYIGQLSELRQDISFNPNRSYMRLVKEIIENGQKAGEITCEQTADELTHHINVLERGILYDWCAQKGAFPLGKMGVINMEKYISFMKVRQEN